MDKIFKFVNVMIIILSLLLVSIQSQVYAARPCKTDGDCRVRYYTAGKEFPIRMKCRNGFCIEC
ncbi:unnamed protein product [Trifolium pratense]|uniref:Uncharacterized protein n=1 Tax=Trifolium pratense TaxID=57577 RepID=A0ACB0LKH5_TRIPR|nr:unnamed protein product [Trifolium pratense]